MPTKANEAIDSYLGLDDPVTVYISLKMLLKNRGLTDDMAERLALLGQLMYKELKDNHDVVEGLRTIASVNKLLPEAVLMKLVKSVGDLKNVRLGAGASIAGPFVDNFAAAARVRGIRLNECSLSVTKVALDIGGAGTGAVSSVTGPVAWTLLALSVVSTFNDGYGAMKACHP